MKQIIAVKVIIKCGDELLFSKSEDNNSEIYELPGKVVEFGEDPKAVFEQIALDELGLDDAMFKLQGVCSTVKLKELDSQYISILFSGDIEEKRLVKDSFKKSARWIKILKTQRNMVTEITLNELKCDNKMEHAPELTEIPDGIKNDANNKKVIINTDGGSRGNPGPSASGFIIKSKSGDVIYRGGEYLGISTNNRAEYFAVELALKKAVELGAKSVELYLDSELVAKQLNGVYKVRDKDLLPIYNRIKGIIALLVEIDIVHVRRKFNEDADSIVNDILDAQ